jgi:hypothetical protein
MGLYTAQHGDEELALWSNQGIVVAAAGSGFPEGLDGVVPEDLAHQVRIDLGPAQRQVDGLREACLGVWIVRAEHQEVIQSTCGPWVIPAQMESDLDSV